MSNKKRRSVIIILGLISLLTGLSGSSINLALPEIAKSLDVSSSNATWVVLIGLITSSLFLVMFGRMGDLVSKNTVFLYGSLVFVIGSGVAGLAPTFFWLLTGRVIQAIGISMTMANSMGIVSEYFSNQERAEALAIISMFISVGSISGPAFGGIVMSISSWRWLLLLNVPLGAVVVWFGFRILADLKQEQGVLKQIIKNSNWTGQTIFSVGVVLFFLGNYVFQLGKTQPVLGTILLVFGIIMTGFSFFQDAHAKSPWIAISLYQNGSYLISISILFIVMLVNAVSNILLPFYLQSFQGLTPFVSGLLLMIQSVAMFIVTPVAGYLADHWNRFYLTAIGLVILLISQVGYAFYPIKVEWWLIIVPILLNGVGMALFLSPNNALTMGTVDSGVLGVAGSLNSLARTLGMTLGISMASTILFVQLPGINRITPGTGTTFLSAFQNVFWITVGLTLVGLWAVIFRIVKQRKSIREQ